MKLSGASVYLWLSNFPESDLLQLSPYLISTYQIDLRNNLLKRYSFGNRWFFKKHFEVS